MIEKTMIEITIKKFYHGKANSGKKINYLKTINYVIKIPKNMC